MLGLLLVASCARLNPAFGDGDAEGGTDGGSAESTVGETRGSGTGSDSQASASQTSGSTGTVATDTLATTATDTTGGESTDSGGESRGEESGEDLECSMLPGFPCAQLTQDCGEKNTCAPWSPSLGDELEGTYCFPPGRREEGQRCAPVCREDASQNCGFDLICDVYSGGPQECRLLCEGGDQLCPQGVCLMYEGLDPDSFPLSFCAGECDPVPADGGGCEDGLRCEIDDVGVTRCVPPGPMASNGADCTNQPCTPGLMCAPSMFVPGCMTEECCAPACSTTEECPDDDICTAVEVPFADTINAGYCRPPP